MIRKIALGGALFIGTAVLSATAVAETAPAAPIQTLTATQDMDSMDQSNIIGLKNGSVTTAAGAQIEACVLAFLDGEAASIKAGEVLAIKDESYQELERNTCAEEASLPSGQKYCRKYGQNQNLMGHIIHLQSLATGRLMQIFCLGAGNDQTSALTLREQSLGTLFTQSI